MKITQHMIDQAAVIANAKVGDELEECWRGSPFRTDINGFINLGGAFTYRIKPQPRTVWVNEYSDGSGVAYTNRDDAIEGSEGPCPRMAVEYREVVK